jgi:diacylglycerol kinase (ATP)
MANQPLRGISRLGAALQNSVNGFRDIWRSEEAFRLELVVLFASIPLAFWIKDTPFDAAILIAAVIFVLIIEVLNTAIEALVDRIGPERHELSRTAKDLGSLAVLLASFLAAVIWIAALYERYV